MGQPSIQTKNEGFFQRSRRKISQTLPLPAFHSRKDWRETEKLGRGRWTPGGSSGSLSKLKTLVDGGKAPGPLPTALDERRKGMIDNLRGAAANDFDDRYLDHQTMAHHEALLAFNGYKTAGDNADLKAFAAETAPKLETHAQMVTKLDRSTNADDEAGAGKAAQPNAVGRAAETVKR